MAELRRRQEFEASDPGSWYVERSHLPSDVVHQIVTCLSARDICSLQSCSRYWRALCSSDVVWFHLFRKRWVSTATATAISSSRHLRGKESPKRRHCDCSLARPCSVHSLFKPPGEVAAPALPKPITTFLILENSQGTPLKFGTPLFVHNSS